MRYAFWSDACEYQEVTAAIEELLVRPRRKEDYCSDMDFDNHCEFLLSCISGQTYKKLT